MNTLPSRSTRAGRPTLGPPISQAGRGCAPPTAAPSHYSRWAGWISLWGRRATTPRAPPRSAGGSPG